MRLDCVLVACNDNPKYLNFWPIVKQAWWEIAQLPCILVYVGDSLPPQLANDPAVKFFKAIPGWPTATQAQCIRLLYPALLKCQGAVMLSDMDMIPMQRDWFGNGFAKFDETQFVSLRGIDENEKQIYMCYVGATPKVWSELFYIHSEDSITAQLKAWAQMYPADGQHGGTGWCTDQIELYRRIKALQQTQPSKVGLIPWTPQISRLDRGNPYDWIQLTPTVQYNLQTVHYVDFHMPPWELFEAQIREILKIRLTSHYVKRMATSPFI
jgi:hypothetical protein